MLLWVMKSKCWDLFFIFLTAFTPFSFFILDEGSLAIVIEEDTETSETDTSEDSCDSLSSSFLSVTSSLASLPSLSYPTTSTPPPVINNRHSAAAAVTNHIAANHNHLDKDGVVDDLETNSCYMNNSSFTEELSISSKAGSNFSSAINNKNNNLKHLEIWNFNSRLRIKICKEVKKPGRGKEFVLCFKLNSQTCICIHASIQVRSPISMHSLYYSVILFSCS